MLSNLCLSENDPQLCSSTIDIWNCSLLCSTLAREVASTANTWPSLLFFLPTSIVVSGPVRRFRLMWNCEQRKPRFVLKQGEPLQLRRHQCGLTIVSPLLLTIYIILCHYYIVQYCRHRIKGIFILERFVFTWESSRWGEAAGVNWYKCARGQQNKSARGWRSSVR